MHAPVCIALYTVDKQHNVSTCREQERTCMRSHMSTMVSLSGESSIGEGQNRATEKRVKASESLDGLSNTRFADLPRRLFASPLIMAAERRSLSWHVLTLSIRKTNSLIPQRFFLSYYHAPRENPSSSTFSLFALGCRPLPYSEYKKYIIPPKKVQQPTGFPSWRPLSLLLFSVSFCFPMR